MDKKNKNDDTFLAGIPMGKFQGQISAATPRGSTTVYSSFPLTGEGITSPYELTTRWG